MKFLLALTFVLAVSSQSSFLSTSETMGSFFDYSSPSISASFQGNLNNLEQFYNAIYDYYGINETVVGDCYNQLSAFAFFEYLLTNWELTVALTNGERALVAALSLKVKALNATIYPSVSCYAQSEDFAQLAADVNFEFHNVSDYYHLIDLYGQAHFNDYALAFAPIQQLINYEEYEDAGSTYVPIEATIFANASFSQHFFNIFKAFQNGIFNWVNLTSPYELSNCYNNETGEIGARFYYEWSQVVANTTAANAYNASYYWINNGTGSQLLQQLAPINACFENTEDQARLNNYYGYNIHSSTFDDAIFNFMNQSSLTYWTLFNTMNQQFEKRSFIGAGMIMSEFYLLVAQSINQTESMI